MTRARAIVIGLAALGAASVAGCSLLDPYETIPLKPPPGGHDNRPRVGVCYDAFAAKPEQLLAVAQESCGKNMTPVREGTDYGIETMQVCPVLLPGRATFICQPNR